MSEVSKNVLFCQEWSILEMSPKCMYEAALSTWLSRARRSEPISGGEEDPSWVGIWHLEISFVVVGAGMS